MGSANAWGTEALDHHRRHRTRLARVVCCATLLLSSPAWAQDDLPPTETEAPPAATPEPATPESATPEPSTPESDAAVAPSGPHTANSLQLGIGFRYGVMLNDGDLNPWSTGLGLDVGYTLPNAVYLGASFEYFFGSSIDTPLLALTSNLWQLSAEGGYDVGLGQSFVIRPKVGVGVVGLKTSAEGCPSNVTCESASKTKPAIAPGATFMFFASKFSLAVDVRYDIVLTDPALRGLIFSFGVGF